LELCIYIYIDQDLVLGVTYVYIVQDFVLGVCVYIYMYIVASVHSPGLSSLELCQKYNTTIGPWYLFNQQQMILSCVVQGLRLQTQGSKNIEQGNTKAKEPTGRKGFRVRYMQIHK
jgi:hypothetical protein